MMPASPLYCCCFCAVVAATAVAAAAAVPITSWRLPAVDWGGGGHRLPIPPGAQTVRAVDTIAWGGTTYAFTDVTPQGEIGAFSSKDGLSGWTYHGIVIRKNTSAADSQEVGTPSALVAKDGRVFVYFKYTAADGPRGIGAASASHPLGPYTRLPPPAAAPPHFRRPYGAGGIFDDSQVFEHGGSYHMLHSRKWSNDTPGCISDARVGRNDCIEWMVSKDAEHWQRRGVVLAAHDSAVGPRNCTKADRGLACIHGGLEPMSARIYGDTLVLITDGKDFEVFVAPVSGLAASNAAGLKFEKASQAFLSSTSYAQLPRDYVPTALRVMPRQGTPLFCGLSESHGGLSFVVYPLANASSASSSSYTVVNRNSVVVTPDWKSIPVETLAIPTFAQVVNPSIDRESPVHDAIIARMNSLGATLSRYLHWSHSEAPFPELEPGTFNFTLCDQYVLDFMAVRNAETALINFDAAPAWLHVGNDLDGPLRDPSGKELGEWISRLLGWYTKGGFHDSRTNITYTSPHHLQWRNYEVLNEPDLKRYVCDRSHPPLRCAQEYTKLYDGIVSVLQVDHPEFDLHALSMSTVDTVWVDYFFNGSNHAVGIKRPAYMTYHFYARPDRPAPITAEWAEHMFKQAVAYIPRARRANAAVRKSTWAPNVKVFVNELGVIGGEQCPVDTLFTSSKNFWNLKAALFAYYYGEFAGMGAVGIAASQFTGYPAGAYTIRGHSLLRNFPCVSLLNWNDGSGTAHFWALQMFIDVLGNGPKAVVPVNVTSPQLSRLWPLPAVIYSAGFIVNERRIVLLSNTNASSTFASVLGAAGGLLHTVDENAGHGAIPYRTQRLANDTVALLPFSVALLELPNLKTDDRWHESNHSQATRSRPLPDPYFPAFHVRPWAGHVNDPNGPFYDPVHGKFHLFMQYHSYAKSHGGMGWYHFASDDLTYWIALDGDSPHSNFTGMPTDGVGCPNTNGCFSGSATVTHLASAGGDVVPSIVYPGVHHVPKSPDHPDGVGMAQCLARPANRSDPWLRKWRSIQIVPTDPVGPGVDLNNHFHDDAQPWRSAADGRWYTFASGGSWNRSRGVNILYSTSDQDWRASASHWTISVNPALWNITTGQCNFVSCPEMYPLPGVGYEQLWKSGPVVYESLCGGDQYWLGSYNDETHSFLANPDFRNYSGPPAVYDYGVGRASKSFWHAQSGRRLMWSWINDDRSGAGFSDRATWIDEGGQNRSFTWDSLQSVPRVITLDHAYRRSGRPAGILKVNPAIELDQLRTHPAAGVLRGVVLGGTRGKQRAVLARGLTTQVDVVANFTFHQLPRLEISITHGTAGKETAIRLGASNTAITNYSIMENTNIRAGDNHGEDFALEAVPSSDHQAAEVCIAGCKQHGDCVAWTYVRPSTGDKNGRCAIKGYNHLGTMSDENTISGFMPGHEPQQPLPRPLPTVELDRSKSGEPHGRVGLAKSMPLTEATEGLVTLRVLYDNSVLEIYDGTSVMSHRVYPMLPLGPVTVTLRVENGESTVDAVVYNMGSAVTFSAPGYD